jgi:hypothetical protein
VKTARLLQVFAFAALFSHRLTGYPRLAWKNVLKALLSVNHKALFRNTFGGCFFLLAEAK